MIEEIKKLYTMRQGGIRAQLHINGIWITLPRNALRATIKVDFAMLDFDDLTGDFALPATLPGITVSGASCPPAAEMSIDIGSVRQCDLAVIRAAYALGACDMSRWCKDNYIEWLFKPSWGSRSLHSGLYLPDQSIGIDGMRTDMTGCKLFPAPLPDMDDLHRQGYDNQQHIYEFCRSKPLVRREATV